MKRQIQIEDFVVCGGYDEITKKIRISLFCIYKYKKLEWYEVSSGKNCDSYSKLWCKIIHKTTN